MYESDRDGNARDTVSDVFLADRLGGVRSGCGRHPASKSAISNLSGFG